MNKLMHKLSRSALVVVCVLTLVFPQNAHAGLPVLDWMKNAWDIVKVVIKNVVIVAGVNLGQQLAEESAASLATWIVEGAPGSSPLQYMSSPGDYMKNAGKQAFGNFLGDLSEKLGVGSTLCRPQEARLAIPVGLFKGLNVGNIPDIPGYSLGKANRFEMEPKCDFDEILANYDTLSQSLSSEELLSKFNDSFGHGQSQLDTVMESQITAVTAILVAQEAARDERLANGSYQDLVSPVSKRVIQPSALVAEEATVNTAKTQQERENAVMSGLLASGAEAIPVIFANSFVNSLSKSLIKRLQQGKSTTPVASGGSFNLGSLFGSGKKITTGNGGGQSRLQRKQR